MLRICGSAACLMAEESESWGEAAAGTAPAPAPCPGQDGQDGQGEHPLPGP